MTDEKILALMREGNEAGLTAAMSKYQKLVESIAASMLPSKEDQEEVAADTFYKVWQNRTELDLSKGSLKNYICTVGRRVTLNKLRSVSQTEELPDEERDLGIELDYTTEIAAKQNRETIARCIREMPSPDREMFVYRYYYSMTISSIAEKFNVEQRKVEYILHRCRRVLREALTKGGIIL